MFYLTEVIPSVWRKPGVSAGVCVALVLVAAGSWLRSPGVQEVQVVKEMQVEVLKTEYRDVVKVETQYKDRVITRTVKEVRPDGTSVQTEETVQENEQRDTASRDTRNKVEQGTSVTKETKTEKLSSISRYSLGVSASASPLRLSDIAVVTITGGVRLGNWPLFLEGGVGVVPTQPLNVPSVSLGVRYEF